MTSDSLILLEEMGNHWRLGMTFWMNQNLAQSKRNWCGVTHWNCPMKKGLTWKLQDLCCQGFSGFSKTWLKPTHCHFGRLQGLREVFWVFQVFTIFYCHLCYGLDGHPPKRMGSTRQQTDTVPILQKGRIVVVLVPVLVVVVVVVVIFIIQLNPIIMNRRRSFYLMSWWSTEGLARWGTWNLLLMFKKSWPVGKWFENLEELEIRSFNG